MNNVTGIDAINPAQIVPNVSADHNIRKTTIPEVTAAIVYRSQFILQVSQINYPSQPVISNDVYLKHQIIFTPNPPKK